MRRVVIRRPGGYERLEFEDVPDLPPGDEEVAISVEAVGVNFADCVIRMGLYASAKEYVGWPICPGFEVAGRVVETGPSVRGVAVGDEVLAVTRFGGYASRLVIDACFVRPRPVGWTAVEAAGLPTVFLTAWYALVHCAATQAGQTVLVHSAAGGVGGALLQIARIVGARAVGVVGAASKVGAARRAGADAVIDKSSEDLWTAATREAPGGFDACFDGNGVATLKGSYDHLRPTGRLVTYGHHSMLPRGTGRARLLPLLWKRLRVPRFDPLHMTETNRSVLGFNLSYLFEERGAFARAMDEILGWVGDGLLKPPPTRTFPLDAAAEAHAALESAQTVGKLVLLP